MKRKLRKSLLAVCLMSFSMGVMAAEGDTFTVDGIDYKVTAEDAASSKYEVAVTGPKAYAGATLTIPDEVNAGGVTYKVTKMDASAFQNNTGITALVLGNNVATIEMSCFNGCSNLASVTWSPELWYIGQYAFQSCKALTEVDLRATKLMYISNLSFWYCTGIKTVWLPKTSYSISYRGFEDCSSLENIFVEPGGDFKDIDGVLIYRNNSLCHYPPTRAGAYDLPDGITSIGDKAFEGCTLLTSIDLTGVTEIGNYAFSGCSALTSLHFPSTIRSLGNYSYSSLTSLETVTFEEGLQKYDSNYFFLNCPKIKEVRFPSTITSTYWWYNFQSCPALTDVYFQSVPTFTGTPSTAFGGTTDMTKVTIHVPVGSKATFEAVDGWSGYNIVDDVVVSGIQKMTSVECGMTNEAAAVYDLQGRKVADGANLSSHPSPLTSHLPKGIYIRNGKKIVVK